MDGGNNVHVGPLSKLISLRSDDSLQGGPKNGAIFWATLYIDRTTANLAS